MKVVRVIDPGRALGRILDYGCGYGYDVAHYRAWGYEAEGYDPFFAKCEAPPTGTFDLVTLVYVLNVLRSPDERLEVIDKAAAYVAPGGHFLVVTRSKGEVERQAMIGNWPPDGDGFRSKPTTFQHGLEKSEIVGLADTVGRSLEPVSAKLPTISGGTTALFRQVEGGAP